MISDVGLAKPVVACSPLYPPMELIHAVGFHPLVLWELSDLVQGTAEGDRHLQTFTCSVARRMLEYILSPRGESLSGFLFSNACDTIRNLPEVLDSGLRERGRSLPMFRLHVPAARLASENSRDYLAQAIGRLRDELSQASGGGFSESGFRESVDIYHRFRQALLDLECEAARGALSFADYVELALRSQRQPVEDALPAVETKLKWARQQPAGKTGVGVIVSGILAPSAALIQAMEDARLTICGNDVASLYRSLAYTPNSFSGPEEFYQDFYQHHFPCPTLLYTADQRFDALLRLARERGATGVIFVGEKFCEYEFFEYPYLEKRLNEAGIRALVLEFAIDGVSMEAQKTRIEAFAELLIRA